MKGPNLLIFRDYAVKIGDFGISVSIKDNETGLHDIKGMTKGYVLSEVEDSIDNNYPLTKSTLIKNDYFALFKTFYLVY